MKTNRLTVTIAAPDVAAALACQRMTDRKYEAASMKGNVSENVLSDVMSFSYPRIKGGPLVVYNNIDAGTKNVKCGAGVAKREDGTDEEDACTPESGSRTSTSTSAASFLSPSTARALSTSTTHVAVEIGSPATPCPSSSFLDTTSGSCSCFCGTDDDCGECYAFTLDASVYSKCGSGCCHCVVGP